MTEDAHADAAQPLARATQDLSRLRERLGAAERGEATAADVREVLHGYWRDHGPTIRAAAASVVEDVRRQALTELYKWRTQLNAQLNAQSAVSRPDSASSSRDAADHP
jgi:hypothetical protein